MYKLGVALSGGGAKGFAHLGVLQRMYEIGLKPEILSGTSAGAFAAALVADGRTPKEAIEIFEDLSFQEFVKIGIPQAGLFKTSKFHGFLKKYLKSVKIEDLEIPVRIMATDIEHGELKEFKTGNLADAVVASCSVPIVFSPMEIKGRHYVDGGLLKNFPVTNIRKECEKIIGVNVSPILRAEYKNSIKYVAERSFHYMSSSNTFMDKKACDYLIESSDLTSYSMFDLDHVMEIFNAGYKLASTYFEDNEDKLIKDFPELHL